jgi:hypothetical protein
MIIVCHSLNRGDRPIGHTGFVNIHAIREHVLMPRAHRTSPILDKAQIRMLKLTAIDTNMDFGNNRNIPTLNQTIEQLNSRINQYNTGLTGLDREKVEIDQLEKVLANLIDEMLTGVSTKYGKDSREYEIAGGTRKSERIRKSAETRSRTKAKKARQSAADAAVGEKAAKLN